MRYISTFWTASEIPWNDPETQCFWNSLEHSGMLWYLLERPWISLQHSEMHLKTRETLWNALKCFWNPLKLPGTPMKPHETPRNTLIFLKKSGNLEEFHGIISTEILRKKLFYGFLSRCKKKYQKEILKEPLGECFAVLLEKFRRKAERITEHISGGIVGGIPERILGEIPSQNMFL